MTSFRSLFLSLLLVLGFTSIRKGFSSAYKVEPIFAPKLELHANEEAILKQAKRQMRREADERKRIQEEKVRKESQEKIQRLLDSIEAERIRQMEEENRARREDC